MDNSSDSESVSCFERNEQLDHLRSGLHVKAMKMIQKLIGLEKNDPPCATSLEQRGMLQLLNYLIVDYFNWFGYKNTLQTFAIETGERSKPKPREKLQRELKLKFDNSDLPILLHMLLKESSKNNDNLMNKSKWEHMPLKVSTIPSKPKKSNDVRNRVPKDLPVKATKPSKMLKKPAMSSVVNEASFVKKDISAKYNTMPKDASLNKLKNATKSNITVKDILANKLPSKVKNLAEPSILVSNMPVKMQSVQKPSTIIKDMAANKKPIILHELKESSSSAKSTTTKAMTNVQDQRVIKMPLTRVSVRQSMAETDTQRLRLRAH